MAMTGTADILENHFPWVRSTEVTLTYGKPILTAELSREDQKHLGAYCENVIQQMLDQELSARH